MVAPLHSRVKLSPPPGPPHLFVPPTRVSFTYLYRPDGTADRLSGQTLKLSMGHSDHFLSTGNFVEFRHIYETNRPQMFKQIDGLIWMKYLPW